MRAREIKTIGIVWYSRANYADALSIMADANSLPPKFETWLPLAEESERNLTKKGHRILRVPLDGKVFALWCNERNVPPNAKARIRYAGEAAEQAPPLPKNRPALS
jgi:hypothetical protein